MRDQAHALRPRPQSRALGRLPSPVCLSLSLCCPPLSFCSCAQLPKAEDLERLPYTCAVFDEALRLWPPADTAVRTLLPMNETLHLGNGMR